MANYPVFGNTLAHKHAGEYCRANMPNFWTGEDFCVTKDTIIYPGLVQYIEIKVSREHLPRDMDLQYFSYSEFYTSTRSCYAQLGITICGDVGVQFTEKNHKDFQENNEVIVSIPVQNHAGTTTKIPAETGIGRFFYGKWNLSQGEEIDRLFQSKNIVLGDNLKYGPDTYWYIDQEGHYLEEGNFSSAIRACIGLTDFRYFPKTTGIVTVKSKRDITKILDDGENISLEHSRMYPIIIGETPVITLSERVALVIEEGWQKDGSSHIKSPVIDPSFSGAIRTEIVNQSTQKPYIECAVIKV